MDYYEPLHQHGYQAPAAQAEARVYEGSYKEVRVRFSSSEVQNGQEMAISAAGLVQLLRMYASRHGYADIIEELGK